MSSRGEEGLRKGGLSEVKTSCATTRQVVLSAKEWSVFRGLGGQWCVWG